MTEQKKTSQLAEMIRSKDLRFLMEAHNGLSAKVVEEAGFEGIWASGLSISAAMGVRDNNEASWTQVLEVLEFMADATQIPILLDGDTGYGNFNSMRRLVKKLEQRDVAGVCIEDKIFPKTNSFIKGTGQPLADIDEFAGKIKAGKDAQSCDDFSIVARVEAFIAGWGLEEALKRADAYREAGADAILIHSALRNPSEVLAFKKEWADRLPVIIVPTKYYTTPTQVFKDYEFSVAIWANQIMRSALTAMKNTAEQIKKDGNLVRAENQIVPVSEVFRIQGADELAEAEKLYLPEDSNQYSAVVLAASRGKELGDLTLDKPKCMIDIAGKPILEHIANSYRSAGVKNISVVRGYQKEQVNCSSMNFIDNDEFESTQELYSLFQAKEKLQGKVIVSYGDVLFHKHIPQELIDCPADFAIMVDAGWINSRNKGRLADYVQCTIPNSNESFSREVFLEEVFNNVDHDGIHGEWMGMMKFSEKGSEIVQQELSELAKSPEEFKKMRLPDFINHLIRKDHPVRVLYTAGHWLDINSLDDVVVGSAF